MAWVGQGLKLRLSLLVREPLLNARGLFGWPEAVCLRTNKNSSLEVYFRLSVSERYEKADTGSFAAEHAFQQ
eukprot:1159855-Pelagomonas_calceolata.AAC.2